MIEANEHKGDDEKLAREEYVLDQSEKDRLVAEADAEHQALRHKIELQVCIMLECMSLRCTFLSLLLQLTSF